MITRYYYRDHLSPKALELYDFLLENITLRRESFPLTITGLQEGDFDAAYMGLCLDHPEFSYCPGIYSSITDGVINIPLMDSDDTLFMNKMNQALQEIYVKLNGKTDDYSKVKAIFDYLSSHIIYDQETYDFYKDVYQKGTISMEDFCRHYSFGYTPYAAITKGKAVCQGIAKCFKILCDLFEVPCMCIFCYERLDNDEKGDDHINNIVCIDGVDSYVDVTFALPSKEFPIIHYDVFLVSKEEADRHFIYELDIPASRSEHNYFVKNDLIFDSLRTLRPFLSSYDAEINKHEIRFIYTGDEVEEKDFNMYCIEILNRHAPRGHQWVSTYSHQVFNGILVDSYQYKKMHSSRKR